MEDIELPAAHANPLSSAGASVKYTNLSMVFPIAFFCPVTVTPASV
jgi:hypothetical protein